MTTYFEYGVTQSKSKLASAVRNKSPLTLRLKHSPFHGSDEDIEEMSLSYLL